MFLDYDSSVSFIGCSQLDIEFKLVKLGRVRKRVGCSNALGLRTRPNSFYISDK